MDDVILTRADGTPIPGHPGPAPGRDAPVEDRIAWMRALWAYNDNVTDVANLAFAEKFRDEVTK